MPIRACTESLSASLHRPQIHARSHALTPVYDPPFAATDRGRGGRGGSGDRGRGGRGGSGDRGRGDSGDRGSGRGSFDRGGSRGGSPARFDRDISRVGSPAGGSSPSRGPPRGGPGGPRGGPPFRGGPPRGGPPRGGGPPQGPPLPTGGAPAERRTLAVASHVRAIGVKRPGHGTAGRVVDVFTNHFATTLDQGTIYHYDGTHFFLSRNDAPDRSALRSISV